MNHNEPDLQHAEQHPGAEAAGGEAAAEPLAAPPAARRSDNSHKLRMQFLRAGVTGLLAGGVAVVFGYLVKLADTLRGGLLSWAHTVPAGVLLWPACAALLAMFAVWLTWRFAPEAGGSGIPHIKSVLHHTGELRWQRVLPVKLLGGFTALASGLSLGREGPTVQMGAAAAQLTAQLLKLPKRNHMQLIAAGAGAGLAAAFNAPLAGTVFVIEELRRELSPLTSSMALVAAITADVVSRSLLGQQPSFFVRDVPTPPLLAEPLFMLIGVLAAFMALAFNRSLLAAVAFAQRLPFRTRLIGSGILAGAVGLMSWWWPAVSGGGYANAQEFLSGRLIGQHLIFWLLGVLLLRFALTVLSYATGAPGGIFAPMLAMGASLGLACGLAVEGLWPHVPSMPVSFAVVAMAALFAAVVRAPLTGIVLILEMTGNYELLLPLMVATMTAFLVAERLKLKPIYEALLELRQPKQIAAQDGALWLDVVVEGHSQLDGLAIRSLGWPDGCRIVMVLRGGKELAPRSTMELLAGDHLQILIDGNEREFISTAVHCARRPKLET
jgi:CIC family chloride channel protein